MVSNKSSFILEHSIFCTEREHMINQILRLEEKRQKLLNQVSKVAEEIKETIKELDIKELEFHDYEILKKEHDQIYFYCNKEQKEAFDMLLAQKKLEAYPELKYPTYYPEINTLDIPEEEKLRLDVAARESASRYFTSKMGKKFLHPLNETDIEYLYGLGILTKSWQIDCSSCGEHISTLSEEEVTKYKRTWELQKKESLTEAEQKELDDLEQGGYPWLHLTCDECMWDTEIAAPEELNKLLEDAMVYYRFAKQPVLRYEKL